MNTISRRKTKRLQGESQFDKLACRHDRAAAPDAEGVKVERRKRGMLALFVAGLLLAGCDFHGPWEYYPHEREVYTGIYTYGYVLADAETELCFSKVYELDEVMAENFAFYDSARVTVDGVFLIGGKEVDTTLLISPKAGRPNCFYSEYGGVVGETYKMDAYFEWDSVGHDVKSRFKASAIIPKAVSVKGMNVPHQDGSYEWKEYDDSTEFHVRFLEFPMDMEFVKCAMDYDHSVRGVISVLKYGIGNAESQKTTINEMLEGMTDDDSTGYRGIAMHDPLERSESLGFSANLIVGGYKSLDTLYLMNMMMPIGKISVDFYATDAAYIDYENKVKASATDSRVVPESNIENGMGVFSGMSKSSITLYVDGSGVSMEHIAWRNCDEKEGDDADSWDSRGCRLYQDVACSGMPADSLNMDGLIEANSKAHLYYRESEYLEKNGTCYASHVKAAMMLDTTKWTEFLPKNISSEDKSNAYSDGLKRYCVASNFKSNGIADCESLEKKCLESGEENYCNVYLWNWCADRGWNMDYEQCRIGLVSRYYIKGLKSNIIQREVKAICDEYKYPICKKW